ncbi:hypothetical protein CLCR_09228 [Cladophialophora carrionii]|uniref:Uncharacterized protein n=1 Tax=Cladophialophora carrionii TaxID=86049 RepID=A0A1C1CSF9_9EURO|nr:hypothetical protein CLCR_09228 [Cladophialophora carrionii]
MDGDIAELTGQGEDRKRRRRTGGCRHFEADGGKPKKDHMLEKCRSSPVLRPYSNSLPFRERFAASAKTPAATWVLLPPAKVVVSCHEVLRDKLDGWNEYPCYRRAAGTLQKAKAAPAGVVLGQEEKRHACRLSFSTWGSGYQALRTPRTWQGDA